MRARRARRDVSSAGSLVFACALALAGCAGDPASSQDARARTGAADARVLAIGDAEERFRPALESLRAAVDAGNETEARAVLARLYMTEPTGTALEIARAYERILDGRAAVASLDLSLEAEFQRAPSGAGVVVVWFGARTEDPRTFDVAPGPCTLQVTQTAIDPAGDETKSYETLPVAAPIRVLLKGRAPVRIPLAHMSFGARPGALATRVAFELDTRAGTVAVDDRELPAQRFNVTGGEVVLLAKELAGLELTTASALADHVAGGKCDAKTALSIAVRLPRSERPAALDLLAKHCESIPDPALAALAPALRWLAPQDNLGRDPDAWREWLRRRARGMEKRPDLILPRPPKTGLAGS